MKTQDFGWSMMRKQPGGSMWAGHESKKNYQENRLNGTDKDAPARELPLDGVCSGWIKCPDTDSLPRPQSDGTYKEGVEEGDDYGWYRIRYQEGPGDKAWMVERDGNYLARLEREGKTAEAARLRASLPLSHPQNRAQTAAAPKAAAPSPAPTPARAATSGGGAGAAPAASLSLIEQATKKSSAGDLKGAIKLCDQAITAKNTDLVARRLRGQSYFALYEKAPTKRSKQRYLEKSKADFEFCFTHDEFDEAADEKVEKIDELLAQLDSANFTSSGSGAGAGAGVASPPPSMSHATPTTSLPAGSDLPQIAYSELTTSTKLGEGGFGVVYKGRWKFVDVAVKRFKLGPGLTEEAKADLIAEAQRMYSLRHPNIVQLLAICTESENTCMVLEFMVNGSLFHLLRREKSLDWKTRYKLAFGAAAGLAFLHSRRIVHRDLKTLNVLLDKHMEAKLADFGLSKVKSETASSMQMAGGMAGTPAWMAPENLGAEPRIGEKSDVYAMGLLLWVISACSEPYMRAPNPWAIMDQIRTGTQEEIPADTPSSYAAIIRQCWAMDPSARPDAETVAHALEAMAAEPAAGAGGAAAPAPAAGPSYRDMSGMPDGDSAADGPSYREMSGF